MRPTPKKQVKKLEAKIIQKQLVRSKVEQHTPLNINIAIENTGNTEAKPVSIAFTPTTQVVVLMGTTTWQGALGPGKTVGIDFTIRPDKPGHYSPGKVVIVYSYTDETGATHTKVEQENLPPIEVTKKTVSTLEKIKLQTDKLFDAWKKWPTSLQILSILTILVLLMLPLLLRAGKPKEDKIIKIESEIEEQKKKIEQLSKLLEEKGGPSSENNT
ncbi:MAG: hypothetical protein DRO11_03830 [Methanobacteriota archaeon]|nr:MAG: hypothetical protein DRO11_03830 [Euryarchaeota archaeon]